MSRSAEAKTSPPKARHDGGGILFVHGGDDFARKVFRDEQRGEWSQALPLILEKHGYLGVETACAQALQEAETFDRYDVVLVARLPSGAWSQNAAERAMRGRAGVLVEGPPPLPVAAALELRLGEPVHSYDAELAVVESSLVPMASAFGLPPGARLRPPTSRPMSRPPELEWEAIPEVPINAAQATAWRARSWDAVRFTAPEGARVLADWRFSEDRSDRFPAVLMRGSLAACAFGYFSYLGQLHTPEPFEPGQRRNSDPLPTAETLLLGIIDLLHTVAGATRARVMPWPGGNRWVLNLRHDVDRRMDVADVRKVVGMHRRAKTSATWYWLARHVVRDALQALTREPGQEVALHTEHVWGDGGERELATVEQAAGRKVKGSSAHGGAGSFRYQGGPNLIWADRQGLAYTEFLQHRDYHPHRCPVLAPDGTVVALDVLCMPHHESFDLSTQPGDTNSEQVREAVARFRKAGGLMQIMSHPDLNPRELFELLGDIPSDARLDWTAAEAVAWWRKTHLADQLTLRPLGGSRFRLMSRLGATGVVVQLLRPDGTSAEQQLELEQAVPVLLRADSKRSTFEVVGWKEMAQPFGDAIRDYHESCGRHPESPAVEATVRTNTALVPSRGEMLLRFLHELAGETMEGRRVLDAGCGFGALAAYLAFVGAPERMVAVDIRPDFVELARECTSRARLEGLVDFLVADMQRLDSVDDGTFDLVIANNALIYLRSREAMSDAITELRRVLAPGGRILFYHANKWRWREPFTKDPLVHLLPAPLATRAAALAGWDHNHGRVRLVSPPALSLMLRRSGFKEVRLAGVGRARQDSLVRHWFSGYYAMTARNYGASRVARGRAPASPLPHGR